MSASYTSQQELIRLKTIIGDELGTIYYRLWNDSIWLKAKWEEFTILFIESETNVKLINKGLGRLAGILQRSLINDIILQIVRMTDASNSKGLSNISFLKIAEHMDDDKYREIKLSILDLKDSARTLRRMRNKILAHNDLSEYYSNDDSVGKVSISEIESCINKIIALIEQISLALLNERRILQFPIQPGSYNLLRILENGR